MPGRKRANRAMQLDVYMNGNLLGLMRRTATKALTFQYAPAWLERDTPIAISRQLPLTELPMAGEAVTNYFDGLLPDDARVREKVAAKAGADSTQSFDLLAAVGRDCVGALQFYPQGEEPEPPGPAKGTPVSEAGIHEILKSLRTNPLGIRSDQDFRISLAGVQSKTALLRKDGQWMIPQGATPTTHILKPAIGAMPDGPDLSTSVENEWLCLRLLKAYGMSVAHADMERFEGMKVLSVERFDRRWLEQRLVRLPQEDACQALGYNPVLKYQADGGPGALEIMSLLNESDHRDADRRAFIKSQVLFWLLAAIDGHAKNFSLSIRAGGFRLTPLYDVMSADPIVNPSSLPKAKLKLAMSVGDSRHYKVQEIFPRHWKQTAARCKFAAIDEVLGEVIEATPRVIEETRSELPARFPEKISEPIFKGMAERLRRLAGA